MRIIVAQEAFRILSLHAKMHKQLDVMDAYQSTMRKIEEREILAYNDDTKFSELERLKSELLSIKFIEAK